MNGRVRRALGGALLGLAASAVPAVAALPTCRIGGGPKAPATDGGSALVASSAGELGLVGGVPWRVRGAGGDGPMVLQRRGATRWESFATLDRPAGADGAIVTLADGGFAQWLSRRGEQKGVAFALPTGETALTSAPPVALAPTEPVALPGGDVGLAASSFFGTGLRWTEWSPAGWTRPVAVFADAGRAEGATDVVAVPGLGVVAGRLRGGLSVRVRGTDGVWGRPTAPRARPVRALGPAPLVLRAAAGGVLAAWAGSDGTYVASMRDGGTWSAVRRVGPGTSGTLALATSPSGRAVLAWSRRDRRTVVGDGPLVVSTADRPDGPWSPARAVCRGGFQGGVGIVSAIADDGAALVLTASVGEPPPYRGGGVLLVTRPAGRAAFAARPLTRPVPAMLPAVALPETGPAVVAWASGPTVRRMSPNTRVIGVGRGLSPPTGPPPQ